MTAGALADIVVWDLSAPHLGQLPNPIQRLVLSGSRRDARMVIVDGRIVVDDGAILGVDLLQWEAEARAHYRTGMEHAVGRSVGHPSLEELYRPTFPFA